MILSIIIATYNRADSMIVSLSSVVSQSAATELWECIVVNNNSTDNTAERFAAFAAAHPSVNMRMVCETKQGLSNARNCGIAEAKGEIVVFVDDDETLESTLVESYIAFFRDHDQVLAAGGGVIPHYQSCRPEWMNSFTEQMIANPVDLGAEAVPFPKSRVPAGGNMAFRREIFDKVGRFNPKLGRNGQSLMGGEENDLFARIRRQSNAPIYFVPKAAIYHHIPESKLTEEYIRQLSHNVGRSKRLRAEADNAVAKLLIMESCKQVATYAIAAAYLLSGHKAKAKSLLTMRNNIFKGVIK